MIWYCPDCYSLIAAGLACECGRRRTKHAPLGAFGETPVMLGQLTLLDGAARAARLLGEVCDGPRRYPDRLETKSRGGGWRHKGRSVWVWQERLEGLPLPGGLPGDDESSKVMALLRALAATSLLLVEAPQQTSLFRAQYARNKKVFAEVEAFDDGGVTVAPAPPECFEVVDRLQWSFSLLTPRRRFIALLDPGREVGEEERMRLADLSAGFGVFEKHEEALRWLLGQAPAVTEHPTPPLHRRLVAAEEAAKKAAQEKADKNPTGLCQRLGKLFSKMASEVVNRRGDGRQLTPDLISVVDLGGSVGRHLLARLHSQTWAAIREAEEENEDGEEENEERNENAPVALYGKRWWGAGLWANPTAEGLLDGRVHQLRNGEPAPGSAAAPWSGYAARWWWWRQPFTVQLEEDSASDDGPLILGVGPLRLFGERDLVELLEKLWRSGRLPAAILRHQQADKNLLRWVRHEFPQVPEFPDSWEGGMRAVETALRLARQSESL